MLLALMPIVAHARWQPKDVAICRYAHVSPPCLIDSPTNRWHAAYLEAGGSNSDLLVHIDYRADYDGLAVAWGINNKKGVLCQMCPSR